MKPISGSYRGRDGQKRLWFARADIETMMEDALRKADLFPAKENPAVDIEAFVQFLEVRLDQYAQLDTTVLGLTEFYEDGPPKICINRDLTGAIDDDDTPPGIRGRWRATIAHEASHVVMHKQLFEVNREQQGLFVAGPQPKSNQLLRCLKKNVLFREGGPRDWREVQANMGMASLLMPQSLFRQLASTVSEQHCFSAHLLNAGSAAATQLSTELSSLFDVSKLAASIRLETLGFVSPARQARLI